MPTRPSRRPAGARSASRSRGSRVERHGRASRSASGCPRPDDAPRDQDGGGEERDGDEHDGRRARGEPAEPVRDEVVVDVGLDHAGRLARAAAGHHEHVVEHPREQRDALDHEVEQDDRPQPGKAHVPVRAPPARAIGARRLVHLCRQREQAGQEDDHPEPELLPDDHPHQRRERIVGVAQPVPGQAAEADLLQRRVQQPVQRQDLAEQHADDRDGEQVGDEHDAAVELPAPQAVVEQDRDQQRDRDDQRETDEISCALCRIALRKSGSRKTMCRFPRPTYAPSRCSVCSTRRTMP